MPLLVDLSDLILVIASSVGTAISVRGSVTDPDGLVFRSIDFETESSLVSPRVCLEGDSLSILSDGTTGIPSVVRSLPFSVLSSSASVFTVTDSCLVVSHSGSSFEEIIFGDRSGEAVVDTEGVVVGVVVTETCAIDGARDEEGDDISASDFGISSVNGVEVMSFASL